MENADLFAHLSHKLGLAQHRVTEARQAERHLGLDAQGQMPLPP